MDEIQKILSLGSGGVKPRTAIEQFIAFGLIVVTALMIWKSLIVVFQSESPIVVVLSGSMEPGFYRGDLLLLFQSDSDFEIGQVIVFNIDKREIPIVHRLESLHQKQNGQVEMLTKGDNNQIHDRGLYKGHLWISRKHIMGRAMGYFPYVGMATIWMNDYPPLKYGLIGMLALFVLINRE